MISPTTEEIAGEPLDGLVEQYRAELERLNYARWTINTYLRSIRRLCGLMIECGIALDELTPDIAAEIAERADCRSNRHQYAVFIVRRFAGYLASIGAAKPSIWPPPSGKLESQSAVHGNPRFNLFAECSSTRNH